MLLLKPGQLQCVCVLLVVDAVKKTADEDDDIIVTVVVSLQHALQTMESADI